MGKEYKFKVGQKVIILNKETGNGKFYNKIGIITFTNKTNLFIGDIRRYSVKCDDDTLNRDYDYDGIKRHDTDRWWAEDTLRLVNTNKRI